MSATAPLILVVDDDAGSRKAMALTLQTDGRRVEEFADADAALERAIEDPSVALVVTDLKMPGKSGLDLAADLATARPDVSVLLVTAHGDVETLLSARTTRWSGRNGRGRSAPSIMSPSLSRRTTCA